MIPYIVGLAVIGLASSFLLERKPVRGRVDEEESGVAGSIAAAGSALSKE